MKNNSANILNIIFTVSLVLFPLGFFLIHSWITGFSFLLCLLAIFLLMRPSPVASALSTADWWVVITLSSAVCAVLISSLLRGHLMIEMLDGPSRYLLVIPIFFALQKQRINFSALFAITCPLTLLIFAAYSVYHPSFFPVYLNESPRLNSRAINDTDLLGFYTMALGCVCLYSLDWLKDFRPLAYLKLAGFFSGVILSIFAQCRSAWLTGFILIVTWLFLKRQCIINKKIIAFGIFISIITLILLYHHHLVPIRITELTNDMQQWFNGQNKQTSCGTRLTMWLVSWHLFLLHPCQGYAEHHLLNYFSNPTIAQIATPMALETLQKIGPHNDLLQSLLLSGIFGLASTALILFTPLLLFCHLYRSNPNNHLLQIACLQGICFVIGVFINGMFNAIFVLKMSVTFYAVISFSLLATALWLNKKNNLSSDAL